MSSKIFLENGRKRESVENRNGDIFYILCLVFNKNNYSTHACSIRAYDSRLGAPHLVRYLRSEPLDLVGEGGGVVTSTEHVYFFSLNSLRMNFFEYMMFAGFFFEHNFRTILCI